MASDERALATWLSHRDDDALAATLAARGVSPTAHWNDFFDAAAALLDPVSVDRALTRLPRSVLSDLAQPDDATPPDATAPLASDLALQDETGALYGVVADRVAALSASHPEAFRAEDSAGVAADASASDAAAAERAFSTAGALADVLLSSTHTPLTRTGAGTVSAVDRKRLAEAGIVTSAEHLDDLVEAAAAAGLAAAVEREWVVTDAGERWLRESTVERWRIVVTGFIDALPPGLRTDDGGIVDPARWTGAYPLDSEWPLRAARMHRVAVDWGLLDERGGEPSWTVALRAGHALRTEAFAEQLPQEIDQVYLQADLTAIAPGPLRPALDLRLRRIAQRESRAQASTYRFTAESIGAGLADGESAESIRAFLTSLSLTGIPQPLDYLIESTAARHGLVRVGTTPGQTRTLVTSTDRGIIDAIAVDQGLRALGFVRDDEGLSSRVARDAVYWALADARYPVAALDETGEPEPLRRRIPPPVAAPPSSAAEHYAHLIAVLRASHGSDGDAAWLERELDQAVRSRSTIIAVVRLPNGEERTFTLEASGLGGGRLRGRDRAADIERTLPLSSIVSVKPV